MIMTDPPYNVAYEGKTSDRMTIANDEMGSDEFRAFLTNAFSLMAGCLKPGGAVYVWHASWNSRELLDACQTAGIAIKQTLIWVKNTFVLGHMDYHWQQEPCFYGWKEGGPHYFVSDRGQSTVTEEELEDIGGLPEKRVREILSEMLAKTPTDVIHEKRPSANADHPTMKPVPLLARLIHNSSRRGETVMDPFGGSGSTLMACEQLGRRCVMMEYDPRFADVIVRRWEEYTGHKAERVHDRGRRALLPGRLRRRFPSRCTRSEEGTEEGRPSCRG